MKSAKKQQKSKVHYLGTSSAVTYRGTKTQPGYAGLPAGRKLALKATRGRVGARVVGVVSKAYEQIAKDKRRA